MRTHTYAFSHYIHFSEKDNGKGITDKMKNKLNCVLLIDDDEATNFLNSMVVEEVDCAHQIMAVRSGQEALDYLRSGKNGRHPQPEMIFLDINMPGMNGWEFLDKYQNLPETQRGKIVVVMLTTSMNPDDHARAREYGAIQNFMHKPLTVKMMRTTLDKYFPGWFGDTYNR